MAFAAKLKRRKCAAHLALFASLALCGRVTSTAYDPLALPDAPRPRTEEFVIHDSKRDRDIPIRVYLPATEAAASVVMFSHGLGGSRDNNPYLGNHWAARGYVVVFMQHVGSDSSVWRDVPAGERISAMKRAAGVRNFKQRASDVPAVIDQLTTWNATSGHPLHGRLDLSRIGMSGHSFGAMTTQAVSGQVFLRGTVNHTDPRIRAALALSPGSPRRGSVANAFSRVKIPWMLMTGTLDDAQIGGATPESRLKVFPSLPPGDKYELVLLDAEHSAFSDRALPMDRGVRNPNHHRAILALSTAFWDAYLRNDAEAKTWLAGDAPRTVLEPRDRWQTK